MVVLKKQDLPRSDETRVFENLGEIKENPATARGPFQLAGSRRIPFRGDLRRSRMRAESKVNTPPALGKNNRRTNN